MGLKFKILNPVNICLAVVLILALFFRIYNIVSLHGFAIDADLYSWIVKDIILGKHIRLVGQLTSTEGVFVGPLFYYLLAPFFLMTGMDPIGAVIFATILGIITVFSFYFVFKKLLGGWIGLAAGLLQAILPFRVGFDRWIVPTITINLWCIWYFYSLVKIINGKFKYLILGFFLVGLIWHISMSLAPLVILLPIAVAFSRKNPGKKNLSLGLIAFLIPMLPFFLFELRHGFVQTLSIYNSFIISSSAPILEKTAKVLSQSLGSNFFLQIFLLVLPVILYRVHATSLKLLIIFYSWILSVIGFFILSSKESSEYYFTSIQTIFLILFIFFIAWFLKIKALGKIIIGIILTAVVIYSFNDLLKEAGDKKGYMQKMAVTKFIKSDSLEKGYPCISITYITSPGENTGFKYLYWFNNLKLERPKEGIANYTVVLPFILSPGSVEKTFGVIGVILPESGYNLEASLCSSEDFNINEPLWGYTD